MSKQVKTFVPSATNIQFADGIVQSLDALSVARANWEQTAFKKANEGLYGVLSQCLDVFETKFLNAPKDDQKQLRLEVITRLKEMKVKVQVNSPTLNLFVRYVFCSDRKRAHGYSYVLSAAMSHGIKSDELAAWIVDKGGIEEIKRKMVQSEEAKARQEKREEAKSTAEQLIAEAQINPLATVGVDGFAPTQRNILLAVGNANGEFNVTYVLTEVAESLYQALLKQAAKQIVSDQEEDDAMVAEVASYQPTQVANEEQMLKAA